MTDRINLFFLDKDRELISEDSDPDTPVYGFAINNKIVMDKNGTSWPLSKAKAYRSKLAADVDYVMDGVDDRFEIFNAYLTHSDVTADNLFSLTNMVDVARRRYIGKFDTPMDFIKHNFEVSNATPLFEQINWTDKLIKEALVGYHCFDDRVFSCAWDSVPAMMNY